MEVPLLGIAFLRRKQATQLPLHLFRRRIRMSGAVWPCRVVGIELELPAQQFPFARLPRQSTNVCVNWSVAMVT